MFAGDGHLKVDSKSCFLVLQLAAVSERAKSVLVLVGSARLEGVNLHLEPRSAQCLVSYQGPVVASYYYYYMGSLSA